MTQGVSNVSDEMLKENVNELSGMMERIVQLNPKSYDYRINEFAQMNLQGGTRNGFIAQEVEEVFPEIVQNAVFPAQYDTSGALISERVDFKGIQYTELIPILTQGIKEQQIQIEQLNARLEEMETLLSDMGIGRSAVPGESEGTSLRADYELYQNRPNPFSDRTEIVWRMAEDARVRIIVSGAQGVMISTLYDAESSKGLHSLEWNASDLPSGMYYYSLEVQGQMLIKRAVKIER